MHFKYWLEGVVDEDTKRTIFVKATTTGIPVRRGIKPERLGRPYASDPGDFGRGIYYSTYWHHARTYASKDQDVIKSVIKFNNPIVLTEEEAYELADKFNTVRLPDEVPHDKRESQRLANAE